MMEELNGIREKGGGKSNRYMNIREIYKRFIGDLWSVIGGEGRGNSVKTPTQRLLLNYLLSTNNIQL